MKKLLLVAILAPLALLILLEVFLYIYFRPTETVRSTETASALNTIYDWYTEVDAWGAWHLPNATARHADRCFDVKVASNSYGARDRERSLSGKNRILVVGDSFVEGWGVEAEHRFTNVMERQGGMS
jgi:hypothetical protein